MENEPGGHMCQDVDPGGGGLRRRRAPGGGRPPQNCIKRKSQTCSISLSRQMMVSFRCRLGRLCCIPFPYMAIQAEHTHEIAPTTITSCFHMSVVLHSLAAQSLLRISANATTKQQV